MDLQLLDTYICMSLSSYIGPTYESPKVDLVFGSSKQSGIGAGDWPTPSRGSARCWTA